MTADPHNEGSPPRPTGLRPGQREALEAWARALRSGSRSELVVVPVGYGKTVIGSGSFDVAANLAGADTCLYLTPGDVLRTQVYVGLERAVRLLGSSRPVRKALADNAAGGGLAASGANFIVATYQQVAASPGTYRLLARRRRLHIVCDEAHHLGESGRWAAALAEIPAISTMLLSATPVRLDRRAISGARYTEADEGLAIDPLVHITMRQAWEEGRILKHLNMQMKDYEVQLRDREGELHSFSASEMAELPDFDQACVRQELRWNEDYVQPLVREFAQTLEAKLRMRPGEHQGLVFAATTEHANHLARLMARWHPSLRCVVVHSGPDISEVDAAQRMKDFHSGLAQVLIQVRKASEGFDAPAVSVLLKLDAVFSREPVIQQLGRGLRFNRNLAEAENMLNVFIGRDPRLAPIIEHLEREMPLPAAVRSDRGAPEEEVLAEELGEDDGRDDATPEILAVREAGDAFLDHTGRFVEGQQLGLFGGASPPPPVRSFGAVEADVDVVDLTAELREAIEYSRTWTNRAAQLRQKRLGQHLNHFAAINAEFARETGKRGTLATAAEYRAKGDWMRRRYLDLLR